jgi:biotin carboxyl carrier protein
VTLYRVELGGQTFEVEVAPDGVRVDGVPVAAEWADGRRGPAALLRLGDRVRPVAARRGPEPGAWELEVDGRRWSVAALDPLRAALRAQRSAAGRGATPFRLTAPMPGLIVKVEVKPGDRVRRGQGLVIMEAMKMENELRSEVDGVVASVHAEPRRAVERGECLVVVVPAEDGA